MRTLVAFLAGSVGGVVAGAGAMLIAFPFLFPPAPLNEPPPAAAAIVAPGVGASAEQLAQKIAAGTFDKASPGRDALHWADGGASIYRQGGQLILRLEQDFVAGPGPDLHIYLNTRKVGDERDFEADGQRLKLTKLRAFKGGQNYALPPGTDLASFTSVTIWCERFSEFIGNAELPATRS
jgi:Electron transfer DM13